MNVYVYPTDKDWFSFLRDVPNIDEVNFWRPGGRQGFRQLHAGDLFLFRFGRPHNAIVGGGTFTHFSFAPMARVWEAFGEKNGTRDFATFCRLVARYKELDPESVGIGDETIGNIVLTAPFFLSETAWLPVPDEYERNSPQGCKFPAGSDAARRLVAQVEAALTLTASPVVAQAQRATSVDSPVKFGESVVKRRLGQGGFSFLVTDAYDRKCAVSGEKTLPVLEAAHIRPVSRGGAHSASNGLLLRSDIHKLFDRGYVTITPRGQFLVSERLRKDWSNGRIYYDMSGREVRRPMSPLVAPDKQLLEWHNDEVYKG